MDKCKEGTMPKRRKGRTGRKERRAFRKFEDVKKQLRKTDRELRHMEENRWSYTKNMLRFGFASWVFGLAVFLFAIVAVNTEFFGGVQLTWSSMLVGTPLLVGAPAAPVAATAVSVRKFDTKIKRLRRVRKRLVVKYQKAVLRYVEDIAASRA